MRRNNPRFGDSTPACKPTQVLICTMNELQMNHHPRIQSLKRQQTIHSRLLMRTLSKFITERFRLSPSQRKPNFHFTVHTPARARLTSRYHATSLHPSPVDDFPPFINFLLFLLCFLLLFHLLVRFRSNLFCNGLGFITA